MKLFRATYSGLYEHKDIHGKRMSIEDFQEGWRRTKAEALNLKILNAKAEVGKLQAKVTEIVAFLTMVAPSYDEIHAREQQREAY